MFSIVFYTDKHGRQPIREMLREFRDESATDKDVRIQYKKFLSCFHALKLHGTRAGEPTVKHIGDSLWELRPLAHRVLFFHWQNGKFVLLHHFIKKTQKTPAREIEQAKSNMRDFLKRS